MEALPRIVYSKTERKRGKTWDEFKVHLNDKEETYRIKAGIPYRFGYNTATGEFIIKRMNTIPDAMQKWTNAIQWYRPTEIEGMPRRRQIMAMEPRWTPLVGRYRPRVKRCPEVPEAEIQQEPEPDAPEAANQKEPEPDALEEANQTEPEPEEPEAEVEK